MNTYKGAGVEEDVYVFAKDSTGLDDEMWLNKVLIFDNEWGGD